MHVPSTAFLVSDTFGTLGDECRYVRWIHALCQCEQQQFTQNYDTKTQYANSNDSLSKAHQCDLSVPFFRVLGLGLTYWQPLNKLNWHSIRPPSVICQCRFLTTVTSAVTESTPYWQPLNKLNRPKVRARNEYFQYQISSPPSKILV
jgi:hypothetical protein